MATQRRPPASATDPATSSSVPSSSASTKPTTPNKSSSDEIGGLSVLDVLRLIGGVILLSSCLSWLSTGESLTWGWNPWFLRVGEWKAMTVGDLILWLEYIS
jgi:hypothetical protein